MLHRAILLVALSTPLLASMAHAQGSPRVGRAMWLDGEVPGIWISPRALFAPQAGSEVLSACIAQRGCAPVVEHRACAVPECPGEGWVHVVGRDLAPVGAFPQDYGGYSRELEVLLVDASLATLSGVLRNHPEHEAREAARQRAEEAQRREQRRHEESVRWVSRYRSGDRWELSLAGSLATLDSAGGSFAGATAGLSFTLLLPHDDSDERNDDSVLIGIFLGDSLGAELRVHFLHRLDTSQEAQWITAVGIAPLLTNRFETSAVRVPTYFGLLTPELGVILRADRSPTWYAAWTVPFSFLITHDLAFDVAARLFVIDDWIPPRVDDDGDDENPAELLFMISAGLRLP